MSTEHPHLYQVRFLPLRGRFRYWQETRLLARDPSHAWVRLLEKLKASAFEVVIAGIQAVGQATGIALTQAQLPEELDGLFPTELHDPELQDWLKDFLAETAEDLASLKEAIESARDASNRAGSRESGRTSDRLQDMEWRLQHLHMEREAARRRLGDVGARIRQARYTLNSTRLPDAPLADVYHRLVDGLSEEALVEIELRAQALRAIDRADARKAGRSPRVEGDDAFYHYVWMAANELSQHAETARRCGCDSGGDHG